MTGCPGIPLAAVDFYTELELNNHRAWWAANKGRYDTDVLEPMLALGAALADEFGAAKLFRPQRDVRFSSDKSPPGTRPIRAWSCTRARPWGTTSRSVGTG